MEILSIILNWNRPELLERTVVSYFNTISSSYKLIVLDNGSDESTRAILRELSSKYGFEAFFLDRNHGGEAFNFILDLGIDCKYVHFSENDIEYQPGWDVCVLEKMDNIYQIGQLSLFSPFPQLEIGEVWEEKDAKLFERDIHSFYLTNKNVGTTCVVRKELIDLGLRWKNYESGDWRFPSDGEFSSDVRKMGWYVAWNDRYLATNWGHNIIEFQKNLNYYIENYRAKTWFSIDGFSKRLQKNGFKLQIENGQYKISKSDLEK